MHVRTSIASALVAATLCAGCQSTPDKEASAHREPVYRTGSNIAKSRTAVTSDGVATGTGDQAERALRSNPQMPAPLPGSR